MNGIKMLAARFRQKPKLKSTEQVLWVNHICDRYVNAAQKSVGMYANLHGFEGLNEDGSWTYWVGIDIRFIGIRCADYIIKCHNKSTYDAWIDKASRDLNDVLYAIKRADNLNWQWGDDVNIEFIFRWSDEEKTFDVHLSGDIYAEEK